MFDIQKFHVDNANRNLQRADTLTFAAHTMIEDLMINQLLTDEQFKYCNEIINLAAHTLTDAIRELRCAQNSVKLVQSKTYGGHTDEEKSR